MGAVAKAFKRNNVVLTKSDLSLPRGCEYYLHFDINLPYPEKEFKKCIANINKDAPTEKENSQLTESKNKQRRTRYLRKNKKPQTAKTVLINHSKALHQAAQHIFQTCRKNKTYRRHGKWIVKEKK